MKFIPQAQLSAPHHVLVLFDVPRILSNCCRTSSSFISFSSSVFIFIVPNSALNLSPVLTLVPALSFFPPVRLPCVLMPVPLCHYSSLSSLVCPAILLTCSTSVIRSCRTFSSSSCTIVSLTSFDVVYFGVTHHCCRASAPQSTGN